MRARIKSVGTDCEIETDAGGPIDGVRRMVVTAEAGQPTVVDLELVFVEQVSVENVKPRYHVGGYSDVVALVLANGQRVDLPETR